MKTIKIALAALALLPVGAQAKERNAEVHVSYADLNLGSAAGLHTLDRRLVHAVNKVCGIEEGSAQLTRQLEARRCVTATNAKARQQRNQALAEARVAPPVLASLAR